jgi:hypothetical protein
VCRQTSQASPPQLKVTLRPYRRNCRRRWRRVAVFASSNRPGTVILLALSATSLRSDFEFVEFMAQKAIIASESPIGWPTKQVSSPYFDTRVSQTLL